ncbi:ABC transporter ATP-binding protein [Luteococcus japonicus]|uniref:ABC-type Fe3+-siderophore transport system, ATPase component n=1 Tax=Luteococcus japonicus LSP_Lj1 TaxID=1255658 RepID=A0A1R4KFY3_9ACTN|nr:ABC transporter ATP-binding protein [Luteococcus japonicus]SJN43226.1 ABC-type Fe3+-siderophore transport system, ATPase component [Luteococcus japonicus LSP_Lj1]
MSTSATIPPRPELAAVDASLGYDERTVVRGLDLEIPPGEFTVIIGPNACGKSTTLKAFARLLAPREGSVLLDGRAIGQQRTVEVARRIALLPQGSVVPEGITVVDLVCRGRFAHQRFLRRWSAADSRAVNDAMECTGVLQLASRAVDELSGGQRQRVWLAAALAQDTPVLLLDEPTTYLDIGHQLEVLDLCRSLQRQGRTIVAVLHDLGQAARSATHLVAMRDGRVVSQGAPAQVLTPELIAQVFGLEARILTDPVDGRPVVVPVRSLP